MRAAVVEDANNNGMPGSGGGEADLQRYHRQMLLPGVGAEGQRRLAAGRALVVGCGALGTVIADLLVRAGVGRVSVIDRDIVELTNLQRQTLFDEADAATAAPKAAAAAEKLRRVNSAVEVRGVVGDFNWRTAERALEEAGVSGSAGAGAAAASVVLDATDNFQTRYLINDVCVKRGVPYVYGGAVGTAGVSMTIVPRPLAGAGPCLRCIFPEMPAPGTVETCDTAGVLGPVTAMVGAQQAAEGIKLLLGRLDIVSRRLVQLDLWSNARRGIEVGGAKEDCPCCAGREFPFLEGSMAGGTTVLCGRNSVQVNPPLEAVRGRLDLEGLARRLSAHGAFEANRLTMRGVLSREGLELTVFPDARAIVKGTTDPSVALSVYARYIGT